MTPFKYHFDPVAFARELLGFQPDATQAQLLGTTHRRVILNCHRQWGKSTVAALRAVHQAVTREGQQVIIVSTDARHSQRLANLCRGLARRLGLRVKGDGTNERSLAFENGSVIIPLPGKADAVRGFTAHLLIIDEAAGVPDEVYAAATPMLAATDGDLWLLSTPKGKRGFFYTEWSGTDSAAYPWLRIEGKPADHKRISQEFLANEQRGQTAEQHEAEYGCQFVTEGRYVFHEEWLERAFRTDIPTFDLLSRTDLQFVKHPPAYYMSLDLGYLRDHAALVILEYRPIPTGTRDAATYQFLYQRELRLVHIERFRLRTGVRDLVARVSQLCQHPHLAHNTQLLIDATSQPMVVQLFRDAKLPVNLIPVTITSGEKVVVSGSERSVPKKLLVSCLETVFERDILKIAAALGQADLMQDELRQFERWSGRGGKLKFGAGAGHDDLVMALAMAVWWAWTNRKHLLLGPERKPLD
jgi:hypothetical protein